MALPQADRAGHEPSPRGLGHSVTIPSAGDVFTIPYPFVRDTYVDIDASSEANETVELPTWKPGTRYEDVGPEDRGTIADGIGSATFTVIDAHKPGHFPVRVFFTRKFTTPDGHTFGKGKLHIVTLEKFRRLTRGFQHPFGIDEPLVSYWNPQKAEAEFRAMLAEYAAQGTDARSGETEGLDPKGDGPVSEGNAP